MLTKLKKNKIIRWIYFRLISIITTFSPKLATKLVYRLNIGKPLNLKNPETLNEKLMWLKLNYYSNNKKVQNCIDKYEVREYVSELGYKSILPNLYGAWEKVDNIDFNKLPNEFVLKCTHGSGFNIICRDKSKLDFDETKKQLKKWMKITNYGKSNAEMLYKGMKPKVICEEFINTADGLPPKDYKIFCNFGKAKFLFVASDRYNNNTKFDFYDINWKWLPVENGHPFAGDIISKPLLFNKMVGIAEDLSKDFPIVRIDFYIENNKVIFGEMTFLHFGGYIPFKPEIYDKYFGELMSISKIM